MSIIWVATILLILVAGSCLAQSELSQDSIRVEDSIYVIQSTETLADGRTAIYLEELDSLDYHDYLVDRLQFLIENISYIEGQYLNLGQIQREQNKINKAYRDLTGESFLVKNTDDYLAQIRSSKWTLVWPDGRREQFNPIGQNNRVQAGTNEDFRISFWGPRKLRVSGGIFSSQFRDFVVTDQKVSRNGTEVLTYEDTDKLGFKLIRRR